MSVWLTIPSKRSPEEAEPVLKQWRERGYKIALWRDDMEFPYGVADYVRAGPYPGYAVACNLLLADLLATEHADIEWAVCGGDDVLPDPNHTAEEIALDCSLHFREWQPRWNKAPSEKPGTFGVMQPTGDRWGIDPNTHAFVSRTQGCNSCACQVCGRGEIAPVHLVGAYIDRVAGSPWIGREFARRMYQGKGPYWPEYTHMGVDEELQAVAIKYGVFWQRPDLTHFHQHWGRPKPGEVIGQAERMPEFLEKANSLGEWKRYKRIFADRQAAGFPGSEPL